MKPDGFIRLREKNEGGEEFDHLFYLEVDRSTEPQETLINRAACYRDHYRRGGLAVRHGHGADEFDKFPFRVLMIFKNAERRNNTAEKLLLMHPPILSQVWLTTFTEATTTPFEAIWTRSLDYRNAVYGSLFEHPHNGRIYRRDIRREIMVEQKIAKHALVGITAVRELNGQIGKESDLKP